MGPSANAQSRISIIIELDSDPIAGSIARPGHAELTFYGWLELLVVLDALHRGQLPEPLAPSPQPARVQGIHPEATTGIEPV